MITIRKATDRGHFDHGWLNTYHTFSFADYHDPRYMHFRHLRVINEDFVKPGAGFPSHPHRDMEIVTVVLKGAIEHEDSMGHRQALRPGEVQRMTAGTGVVHSEFNPSATEPLHLLQVWILPDRRGHAPEYEQKDFGDARRDRLCLVASPDGREGSLRIHQDVLLYVTLLDPRGTVARGVDPGRHAWLQLARGRVSINGVDLSAGDGAAVSGEKRLEIVAIEPSEFLLFDLA